MAVKREAKRRRRNRRPARPAWHVWKLDCLKPSSQSIMCENPSAERLKTMLALAWVRYVYPTRSRLPETQLRGQDRE